MKHKHADLIHAWADGAEVEWRSKQYTSNEWYPNYSPNWDGDAEYRIKSMRNPDLYKYVDVKAVRDGICKWNTCLPDEANLGLIFDGETGRLKSAEVL